MYIEQKQLKNLQKLLQPNKVIVVYGPRRCGKTTLLNHFVETCSDPVRMVSGDDLLVREYLSSQSIPQLKNFVGSASLLIIDEAQRIPNIGLNLKIIVDHVPGIRIIATGSSAFDLAHQLGEPLTGRKFTLRLYPIAQLELAAREAPHETAALLETRLRYGSYPEVLLADGDAARERLLQEIVGDYLFKDILALEGIRHANKLVGLLQLLAFQIGHDVSMTELGTQLGMSKNTIEKYLDLLEKAFVILRVRGFSRNLRKEVTKQPRYFFTDIGIRNAVIRNFNALRMRNDAGMLWENYLVMERVKRQEYLDARANNYFWRTYAQQEVDWVEERDGQLAGYEMKWGSARPPLPREWLRTYSDATYRVITRENYLSFIT